MFNWFNKKAIDFFSIQEKDPTTGVYPATGTYTVKKI